MLRPSVSKRLGRGLCVLAAAGLLSPAAAQAAEHYMVSGLPFFAPYRVAIATLEVNAGKVAGTLAPPAGDARPALPLSGTLADGVLHLTVGSGADGTDLTFTEDERGLHQVWQESVTVPEVDEVVLFRPGADFSEPALTLQHADDNWCGRVYGGLAVALRAADLKAAAAAPAALADLDVVVVPRGDGRPTAKLKDLWRRLRLAAGSEDAVRIDVVAPPGTEARLAREIRQVPQVAGVFLPDSCGEMALAVIPRDRLMDGGKISDAKLKSYLDSALPRLLSGGPADAGGTGTRKFKLANAAVTRDAAGNPVFTAAVTGDAEATRLAKGSWDQFTLSVLAVATAADAGDTISLIPRIGDVKTARKAGPQMPADGGFRPAEDDAVPPGIAHRLVSWLAAAEGGRCAFLTRSSFDEPEGSYGCSNLVIDDVSHAEEN